MPDVPHRCFLTHFMDCNIHLAGGSFVFVYHVDTDWLSRITMQVVIKALCGFFFFLKKNKKKSISVRTVSSIFLIRIMNNLSLCAPFS